MVNARGSSLISMLLVMLMMTVMLWMMLSLLHREVGVLKRDMRGVIELYEVPDP